MPSGDRLADTADVDAPTGSSSSSTEISNAQEPGHRIGRYVVLETLGAGGMGVVYAAYDPEIGRKIAIKLVRASPHGSVASVSQAQARLLREAQAIGSLSHPNVVAVYDVGTVAGSVFVAMEHIDGETLADWLEAKPRSWRDVLAVFIDAGRGLQAAHARGIVHRDFKPKNVMVDRDDPPRVRVLDFGLARRTSAPVPVAVPQDIETSDPGVDATVTGAVLGTPAYMAPEQYAGGEADARSDQFAFCVALYEAIYGVRPFAGDTFAAIAFNVIGGHLRPPPARSPIPVWLRRAIERGLATEPDARWPDMSALLPVLERARHGARTRGIVVASVLVGGAALWLGLARSQPASPCEAAPERIAETWNDTHGEAIERAFAATELAYAAQSAATVRQELHAYAARWSEAWTEACRATHERAEQSEELLDLRMACLAQRRQALDAVVEVLSEAELATVERAPTTVTNLPPIEDCADVERLRAAVRPPDDPAVRERVEAVRARVTRALALRGAGKPKAAVDEAIAARDEAADIAYEPLHAELLHALGTAHIDLGDRTTARTELEEAFMRAYACGHGGVVFESATQLAWLAREGQANLEQARLWLRIARAQVGRDGDHPIALLRVTDLQGSVASLEGDYAKALEYHREALELALATEHFSRASLAVAHKNVALALQRLGRAEEAEPHLRSALELSVTALGPTHPDVAKIRNTLGIVLSSLDRNAEADVELERALADAEASGLSDSVAVGLLRVNLAAVKRALGRNDEAREHGERAKALFEAELGRDHPHTAGAVINLAAIAAAQGDHAAAVAAYRDGIARLEQRLGTEHPQLVTPLFGLAENLITLRRAGEAIAAIQRAELIAKAHPEQAHRLETAQEMLARAKKAATSP